MYLSESHDLIDLKDGLACSSGRRLGEELTATFPSQMTNLTFSARTRQGFACDSNLVTFSPSRRPRTLGWVYQRVGMKGGRFVSGFYF